MLSVNILNKKLTNGRGEVVDFADCHAVHLVEVPGCVFESVDSVAWRASRPKSVKCCVCDFYGVFHRFAFVGWCEWPPDNSGGVGRGRCPAIGRNLLSRCKRICRERMLSYLMSLIRRGIAGLFADE